MSCGLIRSIEACDYIGPLRGNPQNEPGYKCIGHIGTKALTLVPIIGLLSGLIIWKAIAQTHMDHENAGKVLGKRDIQIVNHYQMGLVLNSIITIALFAIYLAVGTLPASEISASYAMMGLSGFIIVLMGILTYRDAQKIRRLNNAGAAAD